MTFPQVAASSEYTGTGTTHNVPLPAGIQAGDLLKMLFHTGANQAPNIATTPTGWQFAAEDDSGGSNDGTSTWGYRIADGTEGATATVTTTASRACAAQVQRITGWHGTTPPEGAYAPGGGGSINPDPPSLSPSWGAEDTLWFAWEHNNNAGHAITAFPANYTDGDGLISGSGPSGVSCGVARRELNAATEDPGVFTIASSNPWIAGTIAVRPAAGGGSAALFDALFSASLAFASNLTTEITISTQMSIAGSLTGDLLTQIELGVQLIATAQMQGDMETAIELAALMQAAGFLDADLMAGIQAAEFDAFLSMNSSFAGELFSEILMAAILSAEVSIVGANLVVHEEVLSEVKKQLAIRRIYFR